MKKKPDVRNDDDDDLRPEYGPSLIRRGVRGKYAERYRAGTNVVLLAPDVARSFPDSSSVNDALRLLQKVAKRSLPRTV